MNKLMSPVTLLPQHASRAAGLYSKDLQSPRKNTSYQSASRHSNCQACRRCSANGTPSTGSASGGQSPQPKERQRGRQARLPSHAPIERRARMVQADARHNRKSLLCVMASLRLCVSVLLPSVLKPTALSYLSRLCDGTESDKQSLRRFHGIPPVFRSGSYNQAF